ncbi:MAG: hypothetical protein WAN16_04520 [Chthoniobacterales bacterium]
MKRLLSAIFYFLIVFAGLLQGEEFTTLDGEHYAGATLRRVEPDGVVIAYSDGVKKLQFQKLPPEVCAKYGYNPETEARYIAQRQSNEIATYQALLPSPHKERPPLQNNADSQRALISSIRRRVETATWNCNIIKNRIRATEAELSSGVSISAKALIWQELEKKKSQLVTAQKLLADAQAELVPKPTPKPTPTPTPSYFARVKLWISSFLSPAPACTPTIGTPTPSDKKVP